jgi:hypothetical protein
MTTMNRVLFAVSMLFACASLSGPPIINRARAGQWDLVRDLLDEGESFDARDEDTGETLREIALAAGQMEYLLRLDREEQLVPSDGEENSVRVSDNAHDAIAAARRALRLVQELNLLAPLPPLPPGLAPAALPPGYVPDPLVELCDITVHYKTRTGKGDRRIFTTEDFQQFYDEFRREEPAGLNMSTVTFRRLGRKHTEQRPLTAFYGQFVLSQNNNNAQ